MNREVEKGLVKIAQLDVKQKKFTAEADAIIATSPYGQWPPPAHRALDKAIKINDKKVAIWNEIRHYVIEPYGKTLWQIAVASKELAVGFYGEEHHLDFDASHIRKAINEYQVA